jgi:L-lactate dehydrogenase complex protein LldG
LAEKKVRSNRQFMMDTPDQIKFLRRIRTALGHPPDVSREVQHLFAEGPSAEDLQLLDRVRQRTAADRQVLLERLIEAGKPINLNVIPLPDSAYATAAIARLVTEKNPEWGEAKKVTAWRHPLIESLNLPEALDRPQVPVHVTAPIPPAAGSEFDQTERERQRADIIASFIGVTSADFCLADTATLVLRNRPGQPRSVALVPSIHIAVITLDQIVADMKELFALLRWVAHFRPEGLSNYMSFISGPSKTADIEATMVHGAHGPREVHLIILTGQTP